MAKAIDYLLQRQQAFGGWMDPLQSFENFRTPFRETQMAVLALSSYFPQAGRAQGWNSPVIDPIVERSGRSCWSSSMTSGTRRRQQFASRSRAAAQSNDALIRQAAVEALGRLGAAEAVSTAKLLGDPSKMVQRTAAWAMRQSYSRHADTPSEPLVTALASTDDRSRWGATRVFAHIFRRWRSGPRWLPRS